MDPDNPVIRLCTEGTRAEFERRIDDAHALYLRAWQIARDDYEACIAAHYVARHQQDPNETLRWNRIALERAEASGDDRLRLFYPSLYVNMGSAHELMGNLEAAREFYARAAELGLVHRPDDR